MTTAVLLAACWLATPPAAAGPGEELDWDAMIRRVQRAKPVTAEQLHGHWTVEKALFRVHGAGGDTSVSDLGGLVGAGGFSYAAGGVYRAGALQAPGRFELREGGHVLYQAPVTGRPEAYEIRVEGDTMRWLSITPARDGDFRVDTYLELRRTPE